jgi:hypothetical protein
MTTADVVVDMTTADVVVDTTIAAVVVDTTIVAVVVDTMIVAVVVDMMIVAVVVDMMIVAVVAMCVSVVSTSRRASAAEETLAASPMTPTLQGEVLLLVVAEVGLAMTFKKVSALVETLAVFLTRLEAEVISRLSALPVDLATSSRKENVRVETCAASPMKWVEMEAESPKEAVKDLTLVKVMAGLSISQISGLRVKVVIRASRASLH